MQQSTVQSVSCPAWENPLEWLDHCVMHKFSLNIKNVRKSDTGLSVYKYRVVNHVLTRAGGQISSHGSFDNAHDSALRIWTDFKSSGRWIAPSRSPWPRSVKRHPLLPEPRELTEHKKLSVGSRIAHLSVELPVPTRSKTSAPRWNKTFLSNEETKQRPMKRTRSAEGQGGQ